MSDYTRGIHELDSTPRGESGLFNLRSFINVLRRRWWAAIGVFVIVVGVAGIHTTRQLRTYRSSSTVRIQDQPSLASGVQFQSPNDWRVDRIQSEQEVIRSQAVGERAADMLGLRLQIVEPGRVLRSQVFGRDVMPVVDSSAVSGTYHVRLEEHTYALLRNDATLAAAPYGESVAGPGFTFVIPARPQIDARTLELQVVPREEVGAVVRAGTTTRRVPETNVVEIYYTGPDPVYVKLTADAVTRAYEEFAKADRRAKAKVRTEFISRSLADQEQRVRQAQNAKRAFMEGQQIADLGAEQSGVITGINELEQRRNDLLVERNVYQTLLGKLTQADTATDELRSLSATDAVQNNDYLRTLYDRWFELSKQRQETITARGRSPWHRDVVAIDASIAKVKQDIQSVSGDYLRVLDSRLSSLDTRLAGMRQTLERFPNLAAATAQLDAEVQTQQSIYAQLAEQYHNARIAEASEEGYVQPIDAAEWPIRPIAPRRKLVFITAGILGLILGIGAAVGVERFDDSIKSPEELRELFGLGLLGTIPGIKALAGRKVVPGGDRSRLVTHLDPRSPVAEAYRSLRTNLAFSRAHAPPRSIIFTSPGPADGKSTTVANLAITFAQQGQRTLLIDADLRRAVLDSLFGVPREPGLTDLLIGRSTVTAAAKPTEVENLFVLGSGPFPSNPSELLGSTAMRDILREATEQFDMVLLDSPPLLAVTDAAVLSTITDAAVLVVRMGETSRAAARRATAQLQAVRGHLVGAVLNDVSFDNGLYYGGYGYYYHQYYGTEANGKNGEHVGVLSRLRNVFVGTPSKH